MSEQSPGMMARVASWFKRNRNENAGTDLVPGRDAILRPLNKRDQAIANLQDGFNTLTDLMSTIKDNLNDQGRRQDELLKYLSALPKAIEGIPETNRLQVESLKAISSRLEQQNTQQNLIGEILGKLADNDAQQRTAVEDVRTRVEDVAEQNKNIAENLSSVGSAMQTVSQNSTASAQVLEQVRDRIDQRDGQLERMMHKQAQRFTWLLSVAILLAVASLAAVVILMIERSDRPGTNTPPSTVPSDARGS
jgi:methyl-accepting chemotaxis protein